MVSEPQKRAFVSDLYSGPKWKKRVARMDDTQITAIYLKRQDPQYNEAVDPEPIPEPAPTTQPFLPGRGPHYNEDEFPIY